MMRLVLMYLPPLAPWGFPSTSVRNAEVLFLTDDVSQVICPVFVNVSDITGANPGSLASEFFIDRAIPNPMVCVIYPESPKDIGSL